MKNKTSFLVRTYALLCIMFFTGCKTAHINQKGFVVISIHADNSLKDMCVYSAANYNINPSIRMIDSCGKFEIGDTLWISKKH
jgi:hypothetical protein